MNKLIIIVIFILIIIVASTYRSDKQSSIEGMDIAQNNHLCPTCPNPGVTCKDAAGQTFYNDPMCLDPNKDPYKGLGCINGPNNVKGCRYCGFKQYAPIKCPSAEIIPITPLPTPSGPPLAPISPISPRGAFKVNLVNECPVTVLAAALGPSKIEPSHGKSWVLESGKSLSLDIPKDWETTQGNASINGPRFFARTGCSYDEKLDRASCETGDCGNKYDCSAAGLGGSPPVSLAEFCFNCGDGLSYYDVSLVDGASMSLDIKPEKPYSDTRPGDPDNPFWSITNLCNKGKDLRDPTICPKEFQLLNTGLKSHHPNNEETIAACFSNCGKWAYERGGLPVSEKCDPNNPSSDHRIENICSNWRKYCCQSETSGKTCKSDSDCKESEACWNGRCECRAFYKKPCPADVCTHPYCENNDSGTATLETFNNNRSYDVRNGDIAQNIINAIKDLSTNNDIWKQKKINRGSTDGDDLFSTYSSIEKYEPIGHRINESKMISQKNSSPNKCKQGYSTQPKPAFCTDDKDCIGDDTLHYVCPSAYTWPNDPETFSSDAREYTITFCPGGTNVKMSDSYRGIPDCSSLANFPEYDYGSVKEYCPKVTDDGKNFACARKKSDGPWSCSLDEKGSCYNSGILCKFNIYE